MMTSNPFNFEIQSLTASNLLGLLLCPSFSATSLKVSFFSGFLQTTAYTHLTQAKFPSPTT